MDIVNTNKAKMNSHITKEKVISIIKKALLCTAGVVGGLFLLTMLYQILEFLFAVVILLIEWLGPVFPRRWR